MNEQKTSRKLNSVLFFIFFSPFIMPSLLMTLTNYPALSLGIYISSFMILLYVAIRRSSILISAFHFKEKTIIFITAVIFLLVLQFSIVSIMHDAVDFYRFGASIILICLVFFSASLFCEIIENTSTSDLRKIIRNILFFMVANAVLGLFGLSVLQHTSSKPVGIFSEPSHFALALSPLLIYACAADLRFNRFYLLFFLLWGVYIENTTTLGVVLLAALVSLRKKFIFFSILMLLVAVILLDRSQYFLERLSLSSDTENLSVIALLRGWEIAKLTILETNYLGGGFQQYGLIGLEGDLSAKLIEMDLGYLNLLDGASSAAKIVGEFGFAGIFLLVFYGLALIRSIINLRKYRLASRSYGDSTSILFHSFIASLFIELFIRGVGYGSTGFFVFFSACVHFYRKKPNRQIRRSNRPIHTVPPFRCCQPISI